MNRKGLLITASVMSAVIASSGANVVIAQQPSPPSASQNDSSELKTKFEELKKSGQEKGEKFISNSDRKDSILKTPAEDLIIQLNIIQSILSGINKDNPNNRTYFEMYVYPELLKIPKITNGDGKSEEAKKASEQLMKIPKSFQDLMLKARMTPDNQDMVRVVENEAETLSKILPEIDKYVNVEGGPTIESKKTEDSNPVSEPKETSVEETDKETDKENEDGQDIKDNEKLENSTVKNLKENEVIFRNVSLDTLPQKCIVKNLAPGWDDEEVKDHSSDVKDTSSPTTTTATTEKTKEKETVETTTPEKTKEVLTSRTTSAETSTTLSPTTFIEPSRLALAINKKDLPKSKRLSISINDKNIEDLVIDLKDDKFKSILEKTGIKQGEDDAIVYSSCINDLINGEETSTVEETEDPTEEPTETTEEFSPTKEETSEENNEEEVPSSSTEENIESENVPDTIQNTENTEPVPAPNPKIVNGDIENVSEVQVSNNSTNNSTSPSRVVGTQPGQYSPGGARVISSAQSNNVPKKGYWNGSRYVSEEEFLKGGVSSSYSGFGDDKDNPTGKKKVGPSVNTGGEVKKNFFTRIFNI